MKRADGDLSAALQMGGQSGFKSSAGFVWMEVDKAWKRFWPAYASASTTTFPAHGLHPVRLDRLKNIHLNGWGC